MRIWLAIMLGATLALGETNPPDNFKKCQGILDDAIHDKNPDIRRGAAEALSLMSLKDNPIESLASMLHDRDVSVRIAVVVALGDFKDRRTLPLLKKALQDPIAEVDFTAAKVLYLLHGPDGEQFLLAVVSKESKASSNYFNKEKRTALRMLHTPNKLFTTIAIEAAGFAPVPGMGFGLSSVQGIVSDPDSSARAVSLLLIGASRDPNLTDAMESSLSDKQWSVRAAAAHLVATHPFPQFHESLLPLLDDTKSPVRVRAAAAYIRLQRYPQAPPPNRGARPLPPRTTAPVHTNHG